MPEIQRTTVSPAAGTSQAHSSRRPVMTQRGPPAAKLRPDAAG